MIINIKIPGNKSKHAQRGFSLIELMIALTLGLIITGVVVQIFSSSRSTYDLEEGLAEVQEQGRFAMEFIANDVRQAGNFGCAKLDKKAINNIVRDPDGPMNLLSDPYHPASTRPTGLIVYEYTGTGGTALTDWTPTLPGGGFFDGLVAPGPVLIPHSDVIVIQYAKALNIQQSDPGSPTRGTLSVVNDDTTRGVFKQDDIIFVSDCRGGDMFKVTNVPTTGPGPSIALTHGTSGNTQSLLEHQYDASADIMKLATRAYFVGVNPNVSPEPSLYRLALDHNNWTPEPLVEGIEQIKMLMGIDTTSAIDEDNNGQAQVYESPEETFCAGGFVAGCRDMSRVIDVKIGFIVRSSKLIDAQAVKNQDMVATNTFQIFGTDSEIYRATPAPTGADAFDPELYRRRRLFTMTVNKRNK